VIRASRPDLVFLDVQMPGLDGFGVIEEVGPEQMPVIIFVTAYDEHAIRAFAAQALDYVLKPIDDDRFSRAVARASRRIREQRDSAFADRLHAVMGDLDGVPGRRQKGSVARFLVKRGGRVLLVSEDEIEWVESAGDYVRLHTATETHLLRATMASMEERLDAESFVRIHRSTIVNVQRIRELKPHFNREYIVLLKDGTELKLSRGFRSRLDPLFDDAL
jgi:two-component system LytT family response regulator